MYFLVSGTLVYSRDDDELHGRNICITVERAYFVFEMYRDAKRVQHILLAPIVLKDIRAGVALLSCVCHSFALLTLPGVPKYS